MCYYTQEHLCPIDNDFIDKDLIKCIQTVWYEGGRGLVSAGETMPEIDTAIWDEHD